MAHIATALFVALSCCATLALSMRELIDVRRNGAGKEG